jgi:MoCo/4Fe-4S cofactor protein with predicted Tat translocation signal
MAKKQLYWKGEDELLKTKEFLASQKNEFSEALPLDEVFSENNMGLTANRRDFLKWVSATTATLMLPPMFAPLVAEATELPVP